VGSCACCYLLGGAFHVGPPLQVSYDVTCVICRLKLVDFCLVAWPVRGRSYIQGPTLRDSYPGFGLGGSALHLSQSALKTARGRLANASIIKSRCTAPGSSPLYAGAGLLGAVSADLELRSFINMGCVY
jgi:hypothetical protein